MVDYFKQAATFLYDVTKKEALKLSLLYDNANGLVMPQSWTKNVLEIRGSGD